MRKQTARQLQSKLTGLLLHDPFDINPAEMKRLRRQVRDTAEDERLAGNNKAGLLLLEVNGLLGHLQRQLHAQNVPQARAISKQIIERVGRAVSVASSKSGGVFDQLRKKVNAVDRVVALSGDNPRKLKLYAESLRPHINRLPDLAKQNTYGLIGLIYELAEVQNNQHQRRDILRNISIIKRQILKHTAPPASRKSVKRADLAQVLSQIDRLFKLPRRRKRLNADLLRSYINALKSASETATLSRQGHSYLQGLITMLREIISKFERGIQPNEVWERRQVQSIYRVSNALLRELKGANYENI